MGGSGSMKYGYVSSVISGVLVSMIGTSAFAMEDLRSHEIVAADENTLASGDFLDGAFGTEAIAAEVDLGDTRGRQNTQNVLTLQNSDLDAVNAGNSVEGNTGQAVITDGAFSNSTFGQAAVVSGNNNNVQMNTTINVNLF